MPHTDMGVADASPRTDSRSPTPRARWIAATLPLAPLAAALYLFSEWLFFESAFSNSTRTHGSLVTLLTGRLPFHTHVTFPPTVLQGEDAHRTLPALLKELGYTSAGLPPPTGSPTSKAG